MANPTGIGGQKSGEPGRNPNGRPKTVWQEYGARSDYLIKKHGRAGILKIAASEELLNAEPGLDPMIIEALANAYNRPNAKGEKDFAFAAIERERLLDRNIGGVVRTTLVGGAPDAPPVQFNYNPQTPEEAADLYEQARKKAAEQEAAPDEDADPVKEETPAGE